MTENEDAGLKITSKTIVSLILGILGASGLWFPIFGIVLTAAGMWIGFIDSRKHKTRLAIVGIVVSLFFLLLSFTSLFGFGFRII